jgi:hypothetical protein
MNSLNDLALKHNTDKATPGHGYTRWYERLFSPLRNTPLTLVEIGIWEGASLRMWRDYFPHATIVGVDNADRNIQIDNTQVVISGQDHPSLPALLPTPIDILIDDASHINALTIKTFQNLWRLVAPGGFYIIEDLQTSYDAVHYDGHPDPSTSPTAMNFFKRLADELNRFAFSPDYYLGYPDLESVQFFPNMCVITKVDKG